MDALSILQQLHDSGLEAPVARIQEIIDTVDVEAIAEELLSHYVVRQWDGEPFNGASKEYLDKLTGGNPAVQTLKDGVITGFDWQGSLGHITNALHAQMANEASAEAEKQVLAILAPEATPISADYAEFIEGLVEVFAGE